MEWRELAPGEWIQGGDCMHTESYGYIATNRVGEIVRDIDIGRYFRPICIEPAPVITPRESVLDEAKVAILKDRNATHGDPEDNFALIAVLWNAYLEAIKHRPLVAHDVSVLMIFVKLARAVTSPEHKDHWTDIIGYAACAWQCVSK